ncbi:MAG: ATP-binding protein [Chloroflexi bacterium]|nr:MAG: ATP-binding protein [Chloroflexota bacterium]
MCYPSIFVGWNTSGTQISQKLLNLCFYLPGVIEFNFMGDQHVLTVPGRYEQIRSVCDFVAAGAKQSGLKESAIFHIELACDEACTNIIEHGYGGEGQGNIIVGWVMEKKRFVITIRDNGRPFNPNNVPEPPTPPTPDDPNFSKEEIVDSLKVGGLGIHFMRKLMDDVQFNFDEKTGNTLVMIKKIS